MKMVGWKDMVSMLGVGSVIEALFGCLWLRARVFFLGQKTNPKDKIPGVLGRRNLLASIAGIDANRSLLTTLLPASSIPGIMHLGLFEHADPVLQ